MSHLVQADVVTQFLCFSSHGASQSGRIESCDLMCLYVLKAQDVNTHRRGDVTKMEKKIEITDRGINYLIYILRMSVSVNLIEKSTLLIPEGKYI